MCLAIPMRVVAIDGVNATCEAKGIAREVSLFLLPSGAVGLGDFVLVHVGYAIQKVNPQAARTAWELYDQALAAGAPAPDA